MKTRILLLLSTIVVGDVLAQGTVNFANSAASRVYIILTMQPVPAGSTFKAALYCAADGVTNESQFVQIGAATTFTPAAGYFNGGTRTTTTAIPPGEYGMFQVRVFEAAYGASYEEIMFRVEALRGKSSIIRVKTGNPQTVPPGSAGSLVFAGLQPIYVGLWDAYSELRVTSGSVVEGNDGSTNLQFTIMYIGGIPATVSYHTSDATAKAGTDYVATSGTLYLNPPSDTRVILVPVLGDTTFEPDETFYFDVHNESHTTYGQDPTGTGTILNDDCGSVVSFSWLPGVTIEGCAGRTYRVEVASQASGPYTAITNLVLPASRYMWVDSISVLGRERYYRTFLLP